MPPGKPKGLKFPGGATLPEGEPNTYDLTKLLLRLNSWAAPKLTEEEVDRQLRQPATAQLAVPAAA